MREGAKDDSSLCDVTKSESKIRLVFNVSSQLWRMKQIIFLTRELLHLISLMVDSSEEKHS